MLVLSLLTPQPADHKGLIATPLTFIEFRLCGGENSAYDYYNVIHLNYYTTQSYVFSEWWFVTGWKYTSEVNLLQSYFEASCTVAHLLSVICGNNIYYRDGDTSSKRSDRKKYHFYRRCNYLLCQYIYLFIKLTKLLCRGSVIPNCYIINLIQFVVLVYNLMEYLISQ